METWAVKLGCKTNGNLGCKTNGNLGCKINALMNVFKN